MNLILCSLLLLASIGYVESATKANKGKTGSSTRRGSKSVSTGIRFSSYSSAIAGNAIVSGARRYKKRYPMYDTDPPICYTTLPGVYDDGTAVPTLGYFICPYNDTFSDSDTYCCGPDTEQFCCGFWDDGARLAGTVVGIIGGVITIAGIIVLCVWYYRKTSKPSKPKSLKGKSGKEPGKYKKVDDTNQV